jgi:hypothetical protein
MVVCARAAFLDNTGLALSERINSKTNRLSVNVR